MSDKIRYAAGRKFDLQLSQALIDERRLGELLSGGKIELKSESWLWERTGNICVEYEYRGRPSGVFATEADVWAHELKRDGSTLLHLLIPVPRLKTLVRHAIRKGRVKRNSGDDGQSTVALLKIMDLIS